MNALMKIGKCFSTVGFKTEYEAPADKPIFDYPRVAERLAFATQRAWDHLNHPQNRPLIEALERDIESGNLNSERLIKAGYTHKLYEGRSEDWITFGIRFFSPEAEEFGAYAEAERLVYSSKKGIGRRIFFGIQGVEIQGLETLQNLSEDHYRVLMGLIVEKENAEFKGIRKIIIDDRPVGLLDESQEEGKVIRISTQFICRLAKDPNKFRSAPKLDNITPKPIPIEFNFKD